jgi:hypothetical protein
MRGVYGLSKSVLSSLDIETQLAYARVLGGRIYGEFRSLE